MYQYAESMTQSPATLDRRRGRPPAASREDVLDLALRVYLHGERVDVQAIAAELGLGRTTIYRWFGSREGLVGETVARAAEPLFDEARAAATRRRRTGAARDVRSHQPGARDSPGTTELPRARAGRAADPHLERGRHPCTSGREDRELHRRRGAPRDYRPPVDPATLAYAIVRLAEAFLFNDATAALRGDVDRLREIEAALLGVRS